MIYRFMYALIIVIFLSSCIKKEDEIFRIPENFIYDFHYEKYNSETIIIDLLEAGKLTSSFSQSRLVKRGGKQFIKHRFIFMEKNSPSRKIVINIIDENTFSCSGKYYFNSNVNFIDLAKNILRSYPTE